jgi:hypothetical protein
MSRVFVGQKHINLPKLDSTITSSSKIKQYFGSNTDFTKATSFKKWLLMKYGIAYKQFNHKSRNKKNALRAEYFNDTGNIIGKCVQKTEQYPDDWDNCEDY